MPPEGGEAARAFSSALAEEHPSRAPLTAECRLSPALSSGMRCNSVTEN